MTDTAPDAPQVTKRRVTLSRPLPVWNDEKGQWDAQPDVSIVDYVPDDVRDGVNVLDAYVADARTRWDVVDVGDLDAGPGGYDGQTFIPDTLEHPLAGTTFPAIQDPTFLDDGSQQQPEQQQQAQFSTAALRNARGAGGTAIVLGIGLQSTAAAATAGTELAGGSPAYARKAPSWSTWANSTSTTTQTHDVPSGVTVSSIAEYTALSGGTFLGAVDVTPQPLVSQSQYTSTLSDTQQ